MSFHVVIPARYQSTRLPAKVLLEIAGKPMLQHVYERALESGADSVTIATDDQRIYNQALAFNADCEMTAVSHSSGTDRIAEVARKRAWDENTVVVNVQGDEPLIPPAIIAQCAGLIEDDSSAEMATLCVPIDDVHDYFDTNVVKLVFNKDNQALYFSRAAIPWHRDHLSVNRAAMPEQGGYYRHLGIYAYRGGFLQQFVDYGPCEMEQVESLEQLRALWHGHRIAVAVAVSNPGPGIDTEEDLKKVRERFAQAES